MQIYADVHGTYYTHVRGDYDEKDRLYIFVMEDE
jgi:hypothetical protein